MGSRALKVIFALVLVAANLFCIRANQGPTGEKVNITLAVLLSGIYPESPLRNFFDDDFDNRLFLASVELALDIINNRSDILPGYWLQYFANDTLCAGAPSVRGFIDQIFQEPTKIMIIGSDCSVSSEPIAELAPFWNLLQISPVSTSPLLSDITTYSTFFRMVASDATIAEGMVSLMKWYGWSRIGVIQQEEDFFNSVSDRLKEELSQSNFGAPLEFSFSSERPNSSQDAVESLHNSPSRIIFINTYPINARRILCQAKSLGMTHINGYLWLVHAWYPSEWWRDSSAEGCETTELIGMLQYTITIRHFPQQGCNETTDIDMTPCNFIERLKARIESFDPPEVDLGLIDQTPIMFDTVWAAALALNATAEKLHGTGFRLENFDYSLNSNASKIIKDTLYTNLLNLKFTGLSGHIEFDKYGDRHPFLRYFQYQVYDATQELYLIEIDNNTPTSNVFPYDTPVDEEFVYINFILFIMYCLLAFAGILFASVLLTVNLVYRNRKVVKLSSPYLNVLIIAGAILFYIDVILFGVDEGIASAYTANALCMTRVWIASLGFSLEFGTVLVKTWRVHYIFYSAKRQRKLNKMITQDWVLFLMVGTIAAVDLILLTPVTAVSTSRLQWEQVELISNDGSLPQIIGKCVARDRFIWLGLLFAYKGILLILGLFLAFETRKVKIRHLNDARQIGMSVYGIVVLSVSLATIGILLENFATAYYAVLGILILIGNSSLLCLIFLPKIIGLWKDPEGVNVMQTQQRDRANSTDILESTVNRESAAQLIQEIQRLKNELRRLNNQPRVSIVSISEEDRPRLPALKEVSGIGETQ